MNQQMLQQFTVAKSECLGLQIFSYTKKCGIWNIENMNIFTM